MRQRGQHAMYFAIVAVFLGVSLGLGMVYWGIRCALAAERALHATLLVIDLVREYVVDHQGAWPRSWQDLERLSPRDRAMFQWPEDAEDVRRYVSVDFGAHPHQLATESVEQFVAIQPQGPCYVYNYTHYPEIAKLLNAIRQSRHGDPDKAR